MVEGPSPRPPADPAGTLVSIAPVTTPSTDDEGVGCGIVTGALGAFVLFVLVTGIWGLTATNLTLLFAALPVTGFLTALGGEFVLAWPVDALTWIVLAYFAARFAETRERRLTTVVAGVLVVALIYGIALGSAVEPSGEFFGR